MKLPLRGAMYRHFKGNLYRVLMLAQDADNPDVTLVIYFQLGIEMPVKTWARKASEWFEEVRNAEGKTVSRFTFEPEPEDDLPDPV